MAIATKPLIPAASGYLQLVSSLTRPEYASGFLKRFEHTTVAGQISSQSVIPSAVRQKGDEIIFRRSPKAEVFEYQKNQELEVGKLTTSEVRMAIGRAVYSNLKLDKMDIRNIQDLNMYVKAYQDSVHQEVAERIDREMLTRLPFDADACNRGPKAGKRSHMFNLGTAGAPAVLTKDNIINYLIALRTVLAEQAVSTEGMYIVLPMEAQPLFYANPTLANACASGQTVSVVLGEKIPKVMGFDIYFSGAIPQRPENGRVAYTILAGRKDATGLVMNMVENRHIKDDSRHFGEFWQTLTVYDFAVLYPEAVACLYATIDFTL